MNLEALNDVIITRIGGLWHTSPRLKMIGKNARWDVHGNQTLDCFLRIQTNQGIEGVGLGRVSDEQIQQTQNRSLAEFWRPGYGVVSPLGRADHALYDLIGKVLRLPVWKLLGGQGQEWVPVYDSSFYFSDLLPENEGQGVTPLLREVDESLQLGHRAMKIKIGRGFRWMPPEQGFQRDVEVLQSIRKVVGPEVKLMIDANNTYPLEQAKRLLETVGDEFTFVEEMFAEDVIQSQRLKNWLREQGWNTLVADGESAINVQHYDEHIQAHSLDVVQPDITKFGMTLEWEVSRRITSTPIKLATHNWGSSLALYPQVQLGRGIPNFLYAEQDTGQSQLFDTSAYTFQEGRIHVPDLPGMGITIRENVFQDIYGANVW